MKKLKKMKKSIRLLNKNMKRYENEGNDENEGNQEN